MVCDLNNDSRSDMFAPKECAGNAEAKRYGGIYDNVVGPEGGRMIAGEILKILNKSWRENE